MDLFLYNKTHRLWICRPCGYAVAVSNVSTHLAVQHRRHLSAATSALRQAAVTAMLDRPEPVFDPTQESCVPPAPESPPIPGLPVHQGYRCPYCPYVARSTGTLSKHQREIHPEIPRARPGRPLTRRQTLLVAEPLVVSCQRFFPSRAGSSFFQVTPPAQTQRTRQAAAMSEVDFIRSQVEDALAQDAATVKAAEQLVPDPISKDSTEVSPWLELTRWPEYLRGWDFTAAARLGMLPDPVQEPLLVAFADSVERLIQAAYISIKERRINEFDQVSI